MDSDSNIGRVLAEGLFEYATVVAIIPLAHFARTRSIAGTQCRQTGIDVLQDHIRVCRAIIEFVILIDNP